MEVILEYGMEPVTNLFKVCHRKNPSTLQIRAQTDS